MRIACISLMATVSALAAAPSLAQTYHDHTAEDGWYCPRTPVLWGFENCYNGEVVHVPGDPYPYKMYFFGNPTGPVSDQIYLARSQNLTGGWQVWKGNGQWDTTMTPSTWVPVISQGTSIYDNAAVGDPSVVYINGTYCMAYSAVGFRQAGGTNYLVNCIKTATSSDGIHWWVPPNEPTLIWWNEIGIEWEVGQPMPANYEGFYHRPSLRYENGTFEIWFDYQYPGTWGCMGYAKNTSGDFLNPAHWALIRYGSNPCLQNYQNPDVIEHSGVYYGISDAFPIFGFGGDSRRLNMAYSSNAVDWTHYGEIILPEGTNCSDVPQFFLHQEGSHLMLYCFYAWRNETPPGGPFDPNYKAISWMKTIINNLYDNY